MESSKQVEERAAAWLAKRDSGYWGPSDEAQLKQWLEASTANYLAFIRLEAAWESSLRLKALSAASPPGAVPPPGRWRFSPFSPPPHMSGRSLARRVSPLAIAATILLVLCAGVYFANDVFRGDRYVTPVGGVASLPIADGSRITLNTDSQIRVALSKTERLIELEQGEAFFDVAKDASRPFIVRAGPQRVVAMGTKFSVRRDGPELRVVVTEGSVRLEQDGVAQTSARAAELPVGSVARTTVDYTRVDRKPLPEAEEYLSWRTGYLVFHESSLADAAAEFNRYNAQKIVIEDPAVADIQFSGKFRATNLDAFVRILENGFPIRATVERDRVVLKSR